jgi:hypothetical protein
MTNFKTFIAVAALSAAIATPAFARTHHVRHHYRDFRGSYNQMIEPSYAVPLSRGSSGMGGSWLHPGDINPSGS